MKTSKATVFARHQRHVNRLPKNQTKSTKLAVKQYCNEFIKAIKKDKSKTDSVKAHLISIYTDNIKKFYSF